MINSPSWHLCILLIDTQRISRCSLAALQLTQKRFISQQSYHRDQEESFHARVCIERQLLALKGPWNLRCRICFDRTTSWSSKSAHFVNWVFAWLDCACKNRAFKFRQLLQVQPALKFPGFWGPTFHFGTATLSKHRIIYSGHAAVPSDVSVN